MKKFTILITLLFLSVSGNSQTWLQEFKNAESLYYKNKFEDSVLAFQKAKKMAEEAGARISENYYKYVSLMTGPVDWLGLVSEKGKLIDELLDVSDQLYGEKSLEYANVLDMKANWIWQISEDLFTARDIYLEAYEIKKELSNGRYTLELDWSYKYLIWVNIAISKENAELADNSFAEFRLHKASQLYGKNSYQYASSFASDASAYKNIMDYKTALRYLYSANDILMKLVSEKSLGEEGYGVWAQTLIDIGECELFLSRQDKNHKLPTNIASFVEHGIFVFETLKKWGVNLPQCYTVLGLIYLEQGEEQKAEQAFKNADINSLKFYDSESYMRTVYLSDIGFAYLAKNNYLKSKQYITTTNNLYLNELDINFKYLSEREKQEFYFTRLYPYFEKMNTFVLKFIQKDPSLSSLLYNLRLSSKGIIVNNQEKLLSAINKLDDEELSLLFNQWILAKNGYSQLITKPNVTQEVLENYRSKINSLERKISDLVSYSITESSDKVTWEQIQGKLNENEAAIEIVRFRLFEHDFTDSIYYFALIAKKSLPHPKLVILKNGNDLEQRLFKRYRASILDKTNKSYINELYSYYWSKIQDELDGINTVYVSQDGIYNLININTLYNTKTNRFLSEELDIVFVGRTDDILSIKREVKPVSAVLMGRPSYHLANLDMGILTPHGTISTTRAFDFNNLKWNDLPATEEEVASLSEILDSNGVNTVTYIKESSSESNLKQVQSPSILHIATHGFFAGEWPKEDVVVEKGDVEFRSGNSKRTFIKALDDDPMHNSGIVLAGVENYNNSPYSTDQDGVLTAFEASTLNLQDTELVVLSACETGVGSVKNGEGVYGLQRAFTLAGANSVLMSLWSVDDRITKELMVCFYNEWMRTGNKHKSFAYAQNKIREQYPSPFYWGAFIMFGK